MGYNLILGDCLQVLATLDSESVQSCITSPPYFGLRNYGEEGQIGLEETPQEFISKLVEVFREVKRVLREDGTLWLNLGDSYNGSGGAGGDYNAGGIKEGQPKYPGRNVEGLKPKDLIGIPWMAAFALRAAGWWLRSEIIWHKVAPMPESITDRPSKAHEQLFLLAKSQTYYYDADAIKEPSMDPIGSANRYKSTFGGKKAKHLLETNQVHTVPIGMREFDGSRNKRTVWTLKPEPSSYEHYAMMPTKLAEPCILAGSKEGDLILDPFCGTGTTGFVALRHHRNFLGIDISAKSLAIADHRLSRSQPTLLGLDS